MRAVILMLLLFAGVAQAAPPDPRLAVEHRSWIDDQARWNAQHMAAARRLEAVAAALRRHDTSFDRHGGELRDHDRHVITAGHDRSARDRHDRLQAAHAEAARAHARLMAEVADLERTITTSLSANRQPPR
jgi:glucuronate isomerase